MCSRPELIWVTEPENKIRFRYESEGGSHGGLTGKAGKKTYPTVELKNYKGKKKILVRATLYTEDKKEHVFEFKGKKHESNSSYIEEELQSDNTAVFKNLHILCKKKYEIEQILMNRKLKNLKDGMTASVRKSLENSYSKTVKDQARSILNSLRLRFDAFEANKPDVSLCTLYSDVISNQKAAGKGELRICRLSQITGSCKGGDEIILLCEKVQKENIKVRFYEIDEHLDVIWEEYGIFSPVDVHYQVAISFKTPPYKSNEEKKVFISLERNTEMSEPREFTYKPDDPPTKKRKLDPQIPVEFGNFSKSELFPDLPESGSVSSISVSSPDSGCNGASGSNSSFIWNESDQNEINGEIPFDMNYVEQCFGIFENVDKNFADDLSFEKLLGNIDDLDCGSDGSYVFNKDNQKLIHSYNGEEYISLDAVHAPYEVNQNLDLIDIDVGLKNLTIKNVDENKPSCIKEFVKKENESSRSYLTDLQHKKQICSRFFFKRDSTGNTFLHIAVILNKNILPILRMSLKNNFGLINAKNKKNQTALHLASEKNRIEAVKILLNYGSNPNLKDSNGNTCYHMGARNNHPYVLLEINRISRFHHEVGVFNDEGLTPMHLAIMQKNPVLFDLLKIHITDPNAVEKKAGKSLLHYVVDFQPSLLPELLKMADIDVNIQDFEGNTPLHIACANENIEMVKILLYAGADPSVKNSKQNFNNIDVETSEDDTSDGQVPADLTTNFEILKLLSAASETLVEDLMNLQNPESFQESCEKPCQIIERLCKYLDEGMKWKKLVPFFFDDDDIMDSLNLSSSPSKVLLDYVKKEYQDNYLERFTMALEFADLSDAVNIMKEIESVN